MLVVPFVSRWHPLTVAYMGCDMRKPDVYACRQQRHRPACSSAQSDQCLYLRFLQSMVSKLTSYIVLPLQLVSITEQLGLSMTWSETLKDMFSRVEAHMIKQGLLGILLEFL